MTANIILIAILLVAFFFGVRRFVRLCKGESSCGGDSGDPVCSEKKKLDGPVVKTLVFHIEGMSCNHCKKRIEDAIAKIDGAVAEVDLEAGTATVKLDREVADKYLTATIEAEGYAVTGIGG